MIFIILGSVGLILGLWTCYYSVFVLGPQGKKISPDDLLSVGGYRRRAALNMIVAFAGILVSLPTFVAGLISVM